MSKFSYFLNDSTPKYATVTPRRTKYGVNKKTWLFRKNHELKTSPKLDVLGPPKKDSLFIIDEGQFVASDFVDQDTTALDSLSRNNLFAVADAKSNEPRYKYRYDPKIKYNQEQIYYNKYYGELFLDKRPVKKPLDQILEEEQATDSTTTKKKGKFGFGFGFLKKKKSKEEAAGEPIEKESDAELDDLPENDQKENENDN